MDTGPVDQQTLQSPVPRHCGLKIELEKSEWVSELELLWGGETNQNLRN